MACGCDCDLYTVYEFFDEDGVRYIGQTKDFLRRSGEWARQGYRPVEIVTTSTRLEARGVEQELIERYGLPNLRNKRNSIAPNNPIYAEAKARGQEILRNAGILR